MEPVVDENKAASLGEANPSNGRPRVSVIIPTYNRAGLLAEALESVFSQTCQRFEVIVVDDGSTDDTAEVIGRFGHRLTYARQDNRGRSAARNAGIRLSSADYLAFLDSDDMFMPCKLEAQVSFLDANTGVDVVYGDADAMDENGALRPEPMLRRFVAEDGLRLTRAMLRDNLFPIHTAMVRRSALLPSVGFDERMSFFEDWDLWLRLALSGRVFTYRADKVAIYRRHAGNTNLRSDAAFRAGFAAIVRKMILHDLDGGLPVRMRQEYRTGASQLYAVATDRCPSLAARTLRAILFPHGRLSLYGSVLLGRGIAALAATGARVLAQRAYRQWRTR